MTGAWKNPRGFFFCKWGQQRNCWLLVHTKQIHNPNKSVGMIGLFDERKIIFTVILTLKRKPWLCNSDVWTSKLACKNYNKYQKSCCGLLDQISSDLVTCINLSLEVILIWHRGWGDTFITFSFKNLICFRYIFIDTFQKGFF